MFRWPLLPCIAMLVLLASCSSQSSGPPAIAEAFAGPATLPIRRELALQAPVVATAKHGDRLEILQTRRRFAQVRTEQGAVGWIDSRQLLTPEQMQDIRRFAESTSGLPSQGTATVVELLNVHAEPSRTSPSFIQLPENASVQVIGHKLAPRNAAAEPRPARVARKVPRNTRKARDREREARRIPPPPMPAPPKPPANWRELSMPRAAQPEPRPEPESAAAQGQKPAVMEDWSLIRTKEKKVGWVLSRGLSMSIPDEVAQYAEGHRITSYFALADIPDEDQLKHAWVWTTVSHGAKPFEFDGLRVFIWNTKRHRYETVYRERDLKGYYPVEAAKSAGGKGATARFSIPVEQDGQLIRKTYAFSGNRVSLVSKEPFTANSREALFPGGAPLAAASAAHSAPASPWYTRWRAHLPSWLR